MLEKKVLTKQEQDEDFHDLFFLFLMIIDPETDEELKKEVVVILVEDLTDQVLKDRFISFLRLYCQKLPVEAELDLEFLSTNSSLAEIRSIIEIERGKVGYNMPLVQ